ncbi:MAG: NAD(P)H-dependent oxidoreductase subunit E, partial [Gemmatimonadales bacterium]|nr:NAD(P)H-dependent oxidoreductase subunit E [Gemmatimonadales bacterium]
HCRARGAFGLLQTVRRVTGLLPGQASFGGELSVETARCVGSCKVGPNVLLDGLCYNAVEPDGLRRMLRALVPASPPSVPGRLRPDAT